MGKTKIGITGGGGITAAGNSFLPEAQGTYFNTRHFIQKEENWIARLPASLDTEIQDFIATKGFEPGKYSREAGMVAFVLDRLLEGRPGCDRRMLNVATSRGSVDFLAGILRSKTDLPVYSSPHSTPGLLSSWPGQLIDAGVPLFFNSSTCSSFGITLMNAMAWLRSGMADEFIAAAVEAPVSSATVSQLRAIRIYSSQPVDADYPCRAMDFEKKENTMVLGEASFAYLLKNNAKDGDISIDGLGVGVEKINTSTSLTEDGKALRSAVSAALKDADNPPVDIIIGHFPGTIRGDLSEIAAYKAVFKDKLPVVLANKWKIGHSLGSSLAANLDLASAILKRQEMPEMPDYIPEINFKSDRINTILISALGFGGQAVSAVVSKAGPSD